MFKPELIVDACTPSLAVWRGLLVAALVGWAVSLAVDEMLVPLHGWLTAPWNEPAPTPHHTFIPYRLPPELPLNPTEAEREDHEIARIELERQHAVTQTGDWRRWRRRTLEDVWFGMYRIRAGLGLLFIVCGWRIIAGFDRSGGWTWLCGLLVIPLLAAHGAWFDWHRYAPDPPLFPEYLFQAGFDVVPLMCGASFFGLFVFVNLFVLTLRQRVHWPLVGMSGLLLVFAPLLRELMRVHTTPPPKSASWLIPTWGLPAQLGIAGLFAGVFLFAGVATARALWRETDPRAWAGEK